MATYQAYDAEFIERYLNDEVSHDEKLKVEDQLVKDPELLEYFTLFMDIDLAIGQPDVIDLRKNLENIYDESSKEWLQEAPMIVKETFEEEVDAAIAELDIMALRSTLNDLHDLHLDELNSAKITSGQIQIPQDEIFNDIFQESDIQSVDLLSAEIDKAIMEDDIMNLRNSLQKIGEELNPAVKTISLRQRFSRLTSIAAILLVMILGGTSFLALNSGPVNSEKAFKQSFVPLKGQAATRGGSVVLVDPNADEQALAEDEIDKYWSRGNDRYNEKDYSGALLFFETAAEKAEKAGLSRMDVNTFAGICLLAENRPDEALAYFDKVIQDVDQNAYIEEAQWYTALCYVRNDDRDQAIALLRELALKSEHEHLDEIEKLLKKLE
jgi:tetratricopeptide (TPR) repeat protein